YQTGLRCLEVAIRRFSGIASRMDLCLTPLSFGDVAINQNEAAIRHSISANLDHPTIGPCSLLAKLLLRIFKATLEFCFDVIGPKFSAFREDAQVIGIARTPCQDTIRQVEHLLEITVPCGQAKVLVKHDHAVTHVI